MGDLSLQRISALVVREMSGLRFLNALLWRMRGLLLFN